MSEFENYPPDYSSSGRWHRGFTFTPPEGPCNEHVVVVVNPENEMFQKVEGVIEKEGVPARPYEHSGIMPSVIVRCTECFRLWSFPEFADPHRLSIGENE